MYLEVVLVITLLDFQNKTLDHYISIAQMDKISRNVHTCFASFFYLFSSFTASC